MQATVIILESRVSLKNRMYNPRKQTQIGRIIRTRYFIKTGQDAPRLRKAPVFSLNIRITASFRKLMGALNWR